MLSTCEIVHKLQNLDIPMAISSKIIVLYLFENYKYVRLRGNGEQKKGGEVPRIGEILHQLRQGLHTQDQGHRHD
jgi:hypothetical protein